MERKITFVVEIGCTQELEVAIHKISEIINFVGVQKVKLLKMK